MSRAVESLTGGTTAALRAIVPTRDEKIEPYGSIVHWTEIYLSKEAGKNRNYPKWIVPVTCGLHASPDCRGKHDVMVLRGMGGTEMLTTACLTGKGNIYSGICFPCYKTKAYPVLAPGSYVCVGDDNEQGTLVKCGGCGTRKRRRIKEPKAFTGLCPSCGVRAATGIPDHKHEESGSWVYSSRPVREGENKGKWPFRCVGCSTEAFAWSHQTKSPNWSGLCAECYKCQGYKPRGGSPPKVIDDWTVLNSESIVQCSRRLGQGSHRIVPVLCGWLLSNGDRCRKEHWVNFKTTRRKRFTGYCPEHNLFSTHSTIDRKALLSVIQSQPQNGNGQSNSAAAETKMGAPYAVTDDTALPVLKTLTAPSINLLAKGLGKSRDAVRTWIKRAGFDSLEKLLESDWYKRGGEK